MVEIATQSLPHIEATLNYLAATYERPVSYAYEPPAGTPWSTAQSEAHTTTIYDLRPAAADFSLDDVGFQFVTHKSAVKNFWDEDEIKRVYYPESVDLLRRVTGAAEARIFDHTLRRRVPGEADRSSKPDVPRQPATRVHVDQTATSGAARLRLLYPDEADELLRRRVAIVNLWRPIKSPVVDAPLAVCDARSVAPQDLIASDLVFRDRRGEIYNVAYNPGQRWFYAPEMRTDEVLLLKCFDSRDDGAVARFAPHTAFIDPTAPANAPPRESIELRAYLIFGEERQKVRH
ncbi:MAG: methyltransferase [Hyphomicrobiales bacterium]|nr:methyltransferase [Hyphomicrobiales bacterium]